eukprot:CAMPEP_0170058842 /NCGR_PEP_ID=MMETSP0019_2-20121128/1314_1 /TAXON_ID=98059 /ORGANISM="Dinobryon sp., Strain UTEXLB2267" /LENGTH=1375 /DNA_ID=CAMNT_0010263885 /DNA_START=413 /DNA_END=4540 /DNA_ORIENTATION=-
MEVLSLLNLIGNIPFESLSTSDIANISRFLTKASMEKQILVFSGSEVVGVCILLLLFLQTQQTPIATVVSSDRTRGTSSSDAVISHEVLRSVAQIVLLSAEVQPLRAVTLRILLHFSKVLHDSVECRFTAIDAIGNLLLSNAASAGSLPGEMFSEVQRANLTALLEGADCGLAIEALHDRCIWTLIDNLKAAVATFTRPLEELPEDVFDSHHSSLLVSSMRALAYVAGVSSPNQGKDHTPTAEEGAEDDVAAKSAVAFHSYPSFPTHYQSLVQSAYTIFTRIMPPLVIRVGAHSSGKHPADDAGLSVRRKSAEIKLCEYAFKFLRSLAAFNTSAFMSSWPLFLSDSLLVDKQLEELCGLLVGRAVRRCSLPRELQLQQPQETFAFPAFRSVVFACAIASSHPIVRLAAVDALAAMLKGLPLRRWFAMADPKPSPSAAARKLHYNHLSDKAAKFILKIVHLAVASISSERHDGVVERLLELISELISNMPLSTEVAGLKLSHADPVSSFEDIAMTIFHGIMTIASSEVIEPTTGSEGLLEPSEAGRAVPVSTRHNAVHWLCGFCKSSPRLDSFVRALNMSYCRSSSPDKGSFIHAMSSICLRNLSVINGNNLLFNLAIRNLNVTLLQLYLDLYTADLMWLSDLIGRFEHSRDSSLRLQGCKMVFSLLNKQLTDNKLRSKEFGLSSKQDLAEVMAAARPLQVTVQSLLMATADSDHLVRGQAAASVGCLLPIHWSALFDQTVADVIADRAHQATLAEQKNVTPSTQFVSLWSGLSPVDVSRRSAREAVLQRLLICAQDKVGTVRGAAFKALGDVVANRGLQIGTYGRAGPLDYRSSDSQLEASSGVGGTTNGQLISSLANVCMLGCNDSKLAVRIQAAWAIGNLLIAVLPFRLHLIKETSPSSSQYFWLQDKFWCSQFRVHFNLLVDSEKIFPVASRALGVLLCGLHPLGKYPMADMQGRVFDVADYSEQLTQKLFNKIDFAEADPALSGESCSILEEAISLDGNLEGQAKRLERSIQDKPQKLVFSVFQCLGSLLWSHRDSHIADHQALGRIAGIRYSLTFAMRFGKTKLQLQSVQLLLFDILESQVGVGAEGSELAMTLQGLLLTRIVEAVSTLAAGLLRRSAVSSCSASSGAEAMQPVLSAKMLHSPSGDEQQMGQLALTGKIRTLQRHLLLLVKACCRGLEQVLASLRNLGYEAACRWLQSKAVEWLIFHAEPFLAWLQVQRADEFAPRFAMDELSMGLPKLSYAFEAGLRTAGQLPREVVGDICGSILSLLTCESRVAESDSRSFFSSDSLVMAHPADASGLQPLPKHIVGKLSQLAGSSGQISAAARGLLFEEPAGYSMFSGASPLTHFQTQCLDFRDHCDEEDDGDEDEL